MCGCLVLVLLGVACVSAPVRHLTISTYNTVLSNTIPRYCLHCHPIFLEAFLGTLPVFKKELISAEALTNTLSRLLGLTLSPVVQHLRHQTKDIQYIKRETLKVNIFPSLQHGSDNQYLRSIKGSNTMLLRADQNNDRIIRICCFFFFI